jgi:prepilin-type N-terminal cleavage/methylation domain-containing protein
MHRSPRSGFTLIELLIVVVIIGILASIAIPKFANTKEKAYVASMKSDLRNLATAEESYYYDTSMYSTSLGQLRFQPTDGVTITISEADAGGWGATATHSHVPSVTCAMYVGGAAPVAPATVEAVITCN